MDIKKKEKKGVSIRDFYLSTLLFFFFFSFPQALQTPSEKFTRGQRKLYAFNNVSSAKNIHGWRAHLKVKKMDAESKRPFTRRQKRYTPRRRYTGKKIY